MDINSQNIINLPPFYIRNKNISEMKSIKKIFFILYGKLIGFLASKTSGNIFCSLINMHYKNDGRIYFENNKYIKKTNSNQKIYFPNKRVLRLVNSYNSQIEKFSKTYLLNKIDFNNGDLIIDCGANIGELSLVLQEKNIDFQYIAFEPDKEVFECLKLNNKKHISNLYNKGLSDNSTVLDLYLDSAGGNSSFVDFGTDNSVKVETVRLDEVLGQDDFIKLLKIDAEGYEPEVINGAIKCLNNVEYISVDFGAERGIDQKSTIIQVNNILINNNFELISFGEIRMTGLYKNILAKK